LLLAGGLWTQAGPPGQYPPQIPIPIQRDPRIPPPGTADGPGARKGTKAVQATGIIDRITARYFTLATPQKKTLSFQYSERTQFLRDGKSIAAADLKPGDRVRINAEEDAQGWLNALKVTIELQAGEAVQAAPAGKAQPATDKAAAEKAAPAAKPEPTPAAQPAGEKSGEAKPGSQAPPTAPDVIRITTGAVNAPPPDQDDSGPPVLRRGIPEKKPALQKRASPPGKPAETAKAAAPRLTTQPEARAAAAPPRDPHEALLDRAREATAEFTEKLPNFLCQQVTTRYSKRLWGRTWEPRDVVTANLVVEGGKESYRQIKIDGKPVDKDMLNIGGASSTGEFVAMAYSLLDPATRFTYRRDDLQSRLPAAIYDFQVDKPNSQWDITADNASITPAYQGTVWIDKGSARILRIEMQATALPSSFPLDTVEHTLDYEFVLLGNQKVLLPARSEALSCDRGTLYCDRNVIEFRNYKRFTSESTVTFDK